MKRLMEFRTELLRLKTMIKAGGTVENPGRIRVLRKTIARMMTIEHEQRAASERESVTRKLKR